MKRFVFLSWVLGVGFSAQAMLPIAGVEEIAPVQAADSVIVVFKDAPSMALSDDADSSPVFSSIGSLEKVVKRPMLSAPLADGEAAPDVSQAARNLDNMYSADVAPGKSLGDALMELRAAPQVEYAEPNLRLKILAQPNDTYFDEVWGLENTGQTYYTRTLTEASGTPYTDINWINTWDTPSFPTNEVIVAVVDTGVDYTHPELVNQMWRNPGEAGVLATNGVDDDGNGYVDDLYGIDTHNGDSDPLDDHAHGTHVAGTIAAEANNGAGIAGVNPYAKIMACKFLSDSGGGLTDDAIDALLYAADMGAKVINNSWGGGSYMQSLQDAIDYCNEQGAVVLAASGNNGAHLAMYPASYAGVISVGATDSDDVKAYFSNWASTVDVMAPGHDILSLRATGKLTAEAEAGLYVHPVQTNLAILSGTSMACPMASGVASLLVAQNPGRDPFLYGKVLKAGCDTNLFSLAGNTPYAGLLGAGRVDVGATLSYSETNAFLAAHMQLGFGFSVDQLDKGESANIIVRVGTWAEPMDNLSIHIVDVDAELSMNITNYSIGSLTPYSILKLTNDFVVTVGETAEYGRRYALTVQLKRGTDVLEEKTITVPIYDTAVTKMTVTDFTGDGFKEVVGKHGDNVYGFDYKGELLWISDLQAGLFDAVDGLITGDFNADGTQTVVAALDNWLGGGANAVILLDAEGNTNTTFIGKARFTDWAVADLNADGRDNLLVNWYGEYLTAYELEPTNELWTVEPQSAEHTLTLPAVGDIDGDGSLELVLLDGPDFGASLSYNTGVTKIRVLDPDGNLLREKSLGTNWRPVPSPILADMNGDGTKDIIVRLEDDPEYDSFGADGYFMILDGITLETFSGWPKLLRMSKRNFCVGDLNGDGELELMGLDVSSSGGNQMLLAYHSDATPVPGFPIYHPDHADVASMAISDVNEDGFADIVFPTSLYTNSTPDTSFFDIHVRDKDGLMLYPYPQQLSQFEDDWGGHGNQFFVSVEQMQPGFVEGEPGPLSILALMERGLQVYETGMTMNPSAHYWGGDAQNWKRTRCVDYVAEALEVRFTTSERIGYNTLDATFHAQVFGDDLDGLGLQWDFDGGGVDVSGTNRTVMHSYTAPGLYTISLTATNAAGETHSVTQQLVTVYASDSVEADFSISLTTGDAPLRIDFTDASLYSPTHWLWELRGTNGWERFSTDASPSFDFTDAGEYDIRLTVSNAFGGGSSSSTNLSAITLGGPISVTTNYVSPQGLHRWPFKSWEEASTNLYDALRAVEDGGTVLVTNGTYFGAPDDRYSVAPLLADDLTLRSVNGPAVTLIDGGGERVCVTGSGSNVVVYGFTIQNGIGANGAGGLRFGAGSLIVSNCWFIGNHGQYEQLLKVPGGAVSTISISLPSTVNLVDCLFDSNWAANGGGAVAGLNAYTTVDVDRSVFRNNRSSTGSSAMTRVDTVRNSLFTGNGGVNSSHVLNSTSVDNCTVVSNIAPHGAVAGAGFRNTISTGNTVNWYEAMDDPLYDVRNNCTTPAVGENPVTDDPLFADPANGDFRLTAASPCIDAGTNYWRTEFQTAKHIQVDFGSSSNTTPGWNNITTVSSGTKIADMQTTNGTASGWAITFNNGFESIHTNAPLDPAITYPDSAKQDCFGQTGTGTNVVEISGLNTAATYEATFYVHSTGTDGNTRWSVSESNGVSIGYVDINPDLDHTPRVIDEITPDANGKIHIQVYPKWGEETKWGTFELKEFAGVETGQPLTNWTDLAGADRIINGQPDIGAYEYNGSNLAPVAVAALVGTELRAGQTVAFSGAGSSDPDGTLSSYDWDFGDGSVSNGASVSHTYAAAGYRAVTLTVTDDDGATDSDVLHLDILPAVPTAPAALVAIDTNHPPLTVDLQWQDTSDNETGFCIERMVKAYPPVDYIIDDTDERVSFFDGVIWANNTPWPGEWNTFTPSPASNAWNNSCRYADWETYHSGTLGNSTPPAYARCFPQVPVAGWYEVQAYWPDASGKPTTPGWEFDFWGTATEYVIYHANGVDIRHVDQTLDTLQWNRLGTFYLDGESYLQIQSALGRGLVDAFRFTKLEEYSVAGTRGAGDTTFTDTAANGITDGRTYHYRVCATNADGSSEPSNEIIVPIAYTNARPTAQILTLSATNGIAPLAVDAFGLGTDADGTIANYAWDFGDDYSGSRKQGAALSNATYSFRVPGTYTVELVVTDDRGFESTNIAEVVVVVEDPIPSAPADLDASPNGLSIDVTWTDRSAREDGYEIERRVDTGSYSLLATTGRSVDSYTDTNVTLGPVYSYRVRATNDVGASEWAGPASTSLDEDTFAIPWSETFENDGTHAGDLGDLAGQHGWTGGGTVQTGTVFEGTQALSLTEETAAHSFIGEKTNIWITFQMQPTLSERPPDSIPADASAVFYVNTDRKLVAYSNQTPIVIESPIFSNGWNKIELSCDFVSKVWNLELNDVPMVGNFPFHGNPASFQGLEFTEGSESNAFFDSITVSDTSDESDTDADGLPDEWETTYWPGDLSHSPGDMASNGVDTVWQCYIAGLDPTDENAVFLISVFRPLTSGNILHWQNVSGRVYSVWWSSNLLSSFQPLETNLPWTEMPYTDTNHPAEEKGFYKIDVELE